MKLDGSMRSIPTLFRGAWSCSNGAQSPASVIPVEAATICHLLVRGYGAVPYEAEAKPDAQRSGLPPPWQPPPHNPASLKPIPRLTHVEIIEQIRLAATPEQIHLAYVQRRPRLLPPPIATAKLVRLAQLVRNQPLEQPHQETPSPSAPAPSALYNGTDTRQGITSSPGPAPAGPASTSTSISTTGRGPKPQQGLVGRTEQPRAPASVRGWILREVLQSLDVFLHLFSASDLAACVRASGELRAARQQQQHMPAAAAVGSGAPVPEGDASASASAHAGGSAEAAPAAAADGDLPRVRELLRRSLAMLLDGDMRELKEAGPKAVVDLSYGLMLLSYEDPASWRALSGLLREAKSKLPVGAATSGNGARGIVPVSPPPAQLAAEVLSWLERKGW